MTKRQAADQVGDENPHIEVLAAKLYEDMESLEARSAPPWDELSDWEKEFYRTCIERLLVKWDVLVKAREFAIVPN